MHSISVKNIKMAKWGEGDPRWIVEDRPDATNVNNWHWLVFSVFLEYQYDLAQGDKNSTLYSTMKKYVYIHF